MQRESPPVQVKEPYSSLLVGFHSVKPVCIMYTCSLSSREGVAVCIEKKGDAKRR